MRRRNTDHQKRSTTVSRDGGERAGGAAYFRRWRAPAAPKLQLMIERSFINARIRGASAFASLSIRSARAPRVSPLPAGLSPIARPARRLSAALPKCDVVDGDKGYDTDALREQLIIRATHLAGR